MNGAPLSWPAGHSDCMPAMGVWPLLLFFCFQVGWGAEAGRDPPPLDPNGKNVCKSNSQPPVLTCCPGWTQEGEECPLALCRGTDACREGEVCVRPGLCRCRPGFFGFNCSGRCPDQFWGPDCRQHCPCQPNGKCAPPNGQCLCHPGWWGPLCQAPCLCGAHGRCHPSTGSCRCDLGWWAPDCSRPCLCNLAGSRCDPVTGRCLCHPGWWGRRCASFCNCHGSPCAQESGRCVCQQGLWGANCQHPCLCHHGASCDPQNGRCTCLPGYWGSSCADPCPMGTYGPQCTNSCGRCRRPDDCHPTDGTCSACAPGWNGTHCTQPCPPGYHGENCAQSCPRCHQGEPCHPGTGKCQACDAGVTGARCELPCPAGRFGLGCRSFCPHCFNGSCDPVSGACLCQAGFWGSSCNQTCPGGFHGANCSETCQCLGGICHPHSGECQWTGETQGALLAGILAPLLLFLLCLCGCCCFCQHQTKAKGTPNSAAPVAEGDPVSRAKHQTLGILAGLTSALPCFSLGGYKLPRVTVFHHDVELPFIPSFIEPPSAVWPSDSFSSFETDEDEAPTPAGQGQPHHLHTEDPAVDPDLFAIPRTSSMAKANHPSVSFAEGTRFAPQSLPGSAEMLSPPRKSKTPRVGPAEHPTTAELRQQELLIMTSEGPCYENVEAARGPPGSHLNARGSKKRPVGSRQVAQRVEALEAALKSHHGQGPTTIYVTVGKAGTGGGGPVQVALKRLGSLRWSKPPPREEAPIRQSLNGLQKPPRKARPAPEEEKEEEVQETVGFGTREAPESPLCLVEGLPAMGSYGEEEKGEVRGLEDDPCPKQAEKASGEENPEQEEPKYENISDWQSLSPAPSPKEASFSSSSSSPLEKL